jgi:Right handed beta helix region
VWHSADTPVHATSSVLVGGQLCAPGGQTPTLTIDPGVLVRFDANRFLEIDGTLIARGTLAAPIRFTSSKPVPTPGDWDGIRFRDSATDATFDDGGNYVSGSIMEYCVVEFAKQSGGSNGSVAVSSSAPFFNAVTLQDNLSTALFISGQGAAVRIASSKVRDNMSDGVDVYASGVQIADTEVLGNSSIGVYAPGIAELTRLTISNNGSGIACGSSGKVNGCLIEGNKGAGIGGCSELTSNIVRGNTGTGISIQAPIGTASGNLVVENGGGGILANGHEMVTGNCVANNGSAPSRKGLETFNNATAMLNTLVNNGVYVTASDSFAQNNLIVSTPPSLTMTSQSSLGTAVFANNWWNTTSAAVINDQIIDCLDDGSLACAGFQPFATGPISGAPDINDCANGILAGTGP